MSTKRPTLLSRRAALIQGTKLSLLAAFCATVGSTVVAACMEHGMGGGHGSGYGSGSGSGYGFPGGSGGGYAGTGCGYGYGYGYGCDL